jgi:hypothetical protein
MASRCYEGMATDRGAQGRASAFLPFPEPDPAWLAARRARRAGALVCLRSVLDGRPHVGGRAGAPVWGVVLLDPGGMRWWPACGARGLGVGVPSCVAHRPSSFRASGDERVG